MTIIEVRNCSFKYSSNCDYAVNDVSFSISAGEFISIVGSNGSGKSTLSKLIVGLLTPSNGSIIVSNKIMSESTVWEIRKKIGIVFQNPDQQFVGTTVADDVAFGLENIGVSHEKMVKKVYTVLEQTDMKAFAEFEPHNLSGGQKQRVAIAGILALTPEVIILDEATSMLDPVGKKEVWKILSQIRRTHNLTLILITHDMEETLYSDRILVMNKGKIVTSGTPKEVFIEGDLLQEAGLELPFCVRMSKLFQEEGINVGSKMDIEGLVEELCKLNL